MPDEDDELDDVDEAILDRIHERLGVVVSIDPDDNDPPSWAAMSTGEQEAHYRRILAKYTARSASNAGEIGDLLLLHTPPHILDAQAAKSTV